MKKVIIISLAFLSCGQKFNKVKYCDAILNIELRTGELVAATSLFNDTIFLNIFKYSNLYKEEAIAFLSDSSYSEQQKMISVFSMQNLNVNNYIDYAEKSFVFYEQNKISDNILRVVLSSDVNSNNLKKVYGDKRFLSMVKNVYLLPKSSDKLKRIANAILIGN